jgi:hypothetical protein
MSNFEMSRNIMKCKILLIFKNLAQLESELLYLSLKEIEKLDTHLKKIFCFF